MHPVIWVAAAAAAFWFWDKNKPAPSKAPPPREVIAKAGRGQPVPDLTTVVENYVIEDKELQAKAGIKT